VCSSDLLAPIGVVTEAVASNAVTERRVSIPVVLSVKDFSLDVLASSCPPDGRRAILRPLSHQFS
jgi:hypothetical protein